MDTALTEKYQDLKRTLRDVGNVAVAFSGGVDSTLLTKVAHDELGPCMIAVTASLRAVPSRELDAARTWCAAQGVQHVVVEYDELTIAGYAQNPPNRCYLCKREVFSRLRDVAGQHGMQHLVDGSNVDDEGDFRPGMRALAELGVTSPLKECGFTKADVRTLSHELGLPTWNMPSAACLASRFPYGETITALKLTRVEAAEAYLHRLGIGQLRVRVHGEDGMLARIEVMPDDIVRLADPNMRTRIADKFHELGFTYISLDLVGFRSGALNEALG